MTKKYTVKDIQECGYTLEPLYCIYCGSQEVTYHQYIGDGCCEECGDWQSDETQGGIND